MVPVDPGDSSRSQREAQRQQALALLHQGQADAAGRMFQQLVATDDRDAHAWNHLGICQAQLGRIDVALGSFQRALALRGDYAEAHNNLGLALRHLGRLPEALSALSEAIRLQPDYQSYHNRALIEEQLGQLPAAWESRQAALRHRPQDIAAWHEAGSLLSRMGRLDGALAHFERALELDPSHAPSHGQRAFMLLQLGRLDEALQAAEAAVQYASGHPDPLNIRGMIRVQAGSFELAEQDFQRALTLAPQHAETHVNHALALLLAGDYPRGWDEYAWRWRSPRYPSRPLAAAAWHGEAAPGRSILVHAEQGLGDTLQFVRFLPLVKARVGRVVLEVQSPLVPLLQGIGGADEVIAQRVTAPATDLHVPLMHLGQVFHVALGQMPVDPPYLVAKPELKDRWKRRLEELPGRKIGIAWQGSGTYPGDAYRSPKLSWFLPLTEVPGVSWVSLQKGHGSEQARELADRWAIHDWSGELDEVHGPFVDTAALMTQLDLVITSDTSLAHLAGGLGIEAWVVLPHVPDWRWGTRGERSFWYPNLRLFRQQGTHQWQGVFDAVRAALRARWPELGADGGENRKAAAADARGAATAARGTTVEAAAIRVEIAPGELLDKLGILGLKLQRIADPAKRANVAEEQRRLLEAQRAAGLDWPMVAELEAQLAEVNGQLWDVEDALRRLEAAGDFGPEFVRLARSVYQLNDRRAALKREINVRLGSPIVEEKQYEQYGKRSG